ncbi:cell envelope integrity protein TolA [Rhodoferax sp.]|uniref:cell envelope integrity protein TolA n=1 Tax=Rhodoferax sp. TaxID=50421 RepID=UPI0019DAAF3F|nr:cell envelope integrity protein TolA [Rhodoferax sp.]MBE0472674.1 cell envelope integrity protein TolA [Rhodoferax sp.]
MHTAADRLEFSPPDTPGVVRAFMLALLAHGLLVAALTWGVHWQRNAQIVNVEAELWAAMPVAAAPRLQAPLPETPEPIKPPVLPEPAPVPVPVPPPVAAPEPPKVDIALEREKQRLQKQKQEQLAREQQEKLKQAQLEQARLQQEKLKEAQRKAEQLKKEQAQKAKLAQEKKLAEQQARQREAQRAEHMKRIAGLADASGAPGASGTALKSAGPSANYAGRIVARIKPNIVFTDTISGNPTAVVEVHAAPDGKILASKLTRSSGVPAWDEAVLRAIAKTEVLPRDTDGRVPSPLEISFRPKD